MSVCAFALVIDGQVDFVTAKVQPEDLLNKEDWDSPEAAQYVASGVLLSQRAYAFFFKIDFYSFIVLLEGPQKEAANRCQMKWS